jgi:hypothetical protein
VDASDRDRDRFHERRDRRLVGLDREDLGLRDSEQFLQAAVGVDADQAEVVAHVSAPDPAGIAPAAGAQRMDGHPRPDAEAIFRPGAELLDRPGELVALDSRIGRLVEDLKLAGEEVEVRAADPHGVRVDDHLLRPGRLRLRQIEDLHVPDSPSHRSEHGNNLEDLVNWLNANGGHKHRRRV